MKISLTSPRQRSSMSRAARNTRNKEAANPFLEWQLDGLALRNNPRARQPKLLILVNDEVLATTQVPDVAVVRKPLPSGRGSAILSVPGRSKRKSW